MSKLRPGKDGDPLPCGTFVFRLCENRNIQINFVAMEERKALPGMFELSTQEKNSEHRRLSIWVEELTLPDQAWDFMGKKPKYTTVACSCIDAVRSVAPPIGFDRLDIAWEQAKNDDGTPNQRPGAEGHAGIINLHQGDKKKDREKRKDLRSRLADAFEISPVRVPHGFTEEELRLEAYLHYEQNAATGDDPEKHWLEAVRKLRRAMVAQHKRHLQLAQTCDASSQPPTDRGG